VQNRLLVCIRDERASREEIGDPYSLKFYLPNFEDLVDPEYDFGKDQPSPKRGDRYEHDWYPHQFFDEPVFNGMLMSKAIIAPTIEARIRRKGGVHAFLRLDPQVPVMGDCGAFTYLLEEKPVYTVQQVLDYYNEFGFNYGVSLDHLAFVTVELLEGALVQGRVKERWWQGKTTEQIQAERFELTLKNAQEFLDLCARQKPGFKPIGIAQGGTPDLYYAAVERLITMGYEYVALGGLVKSSDQEILAILERIRPLIKNGIQLHIFGVARLSLVPDFVRLGVTTADSAAPLRRAFLGTGEDNYWTANGQKYAAIRVPEAEGKRSKRGVASVAEVLQRNGKLSAESLVELEQKVLRLLRAYDKGEATLDQTLEAVLVYDRLYGDKRDHEKAYRRTLTDRPWQICGCPICKAVGVEVIIFRGNNRNRRRGFHNIKVFYDQFRQLVENSIPEPAKSQLGSQLRLDLE
jgi:hypothetical protein